jgi:hypothetical protein
VSRTIANKQGLLHFRLQSVIGFSTLGFLGAFLLDPNLSAVRSRLMRRSE